MWVKELVAVCGVRLRGTKGGRKTRVRTSCSGVTSLKTFLGVAEAIGAAVRFFQDNGELMVGCMVLFALWQQVLCSRGGWLSASGYCGMFPFDSLYATLILRFDKSMG